MYLLLGQDRWFRLLNDVCIVVFDKTESIGNVTGKVVNRECVQFATRGSSITSYCSSIYRETIQLHVLDTQETFNTDYPNYVVLGKNFTFNKAAHHYHGTSLFNPNVFTREDLEVIYYMMHFEKFLITVCERKEDLQYLRDTSEHRLSLFTILENLSGFDFKCDCRCMVHKIHDKKNCADQQMYRDILLHNFACTLSQISDFFNMHDIEGSSDLDDNATHQLKKKRPGFMDTIKKPLDYVCQSFNNGHNLILGYGLALLGIMIIRKMYY